MIKNIARPTFSLALILLLLLLSSCTHRRHIDKQVLLVEHNTSTQPENTISPPPITIWIHGTIFFTKPPGYETYHKKPALIHTNELPEKNRFRRIAQTIAEQDPHHFPMEEFYIFCWSGHFSRRERKIAAKKLYQDLITLTKTYEEKYYCYPTIRIIAHSHGGNLALHMAKLKTMLCPLTIKSLILLACPVQEKTMHLIDTPMFQRIYSLYSSFDIIQVIAPQLKRAEHTKHKKRRGCKIPAFSSRLFPQHPHVIQAKIKVNDFPITHSRFSRREFVEMLPKILQKLDSWDERKQKTHRLYKYKLLCIYKAKKSSPLAH